MDEPFDSEVLSTAVKRQSALAALSQEPHHRDELEDTLDVSKTTCHRIIRSFDDWGLLKRSDSGYELTRLGETVHDRVETFESGVRLAYRLQPLLHKLETAAIDVDLEWFRDATVTRPEPGNPYPYADRTMELFRQSDTLRVVDCNPLVPPVYVEQMLEIALETGMNGEFILTEALAVGNMEQFPDLQRRVAESDDTTGLYLVYDDIPFGMALYDDHLDLRVYDDETGTPILYVDTDNPEAMNWAESTYRDFRERARPATSLDDFPDWAPKTGLQDPSRD